MATDESVANIADSLGRVSVVNDTGDGHDVGPDGEPAPKNDEEYGQSQLTLRAIVSSKEAGVIIGKAGKNVADLRDETGVKAGVSKAVLGVHDRVLTVTGSLDQLSKAYAIIAKGLLEGAPQMGMGGVISNNGTHRKWQCNCNLELRRCAIFLKLSLPTITNVLGSCPSSHLAQSDGHHYWSARTED
jgi:hypothetical protein